MKGKHGKIRANIIGPLNNILRNIGPNDGNQGFMRSKWKLISSTQEIWRLAWTSEQFGTDWQLFKGEHKYWNFLLKDPGVVKNCRNLEKELWIIYCDSIAQGEKWAHLLDWCHYIKSKISQMWIFLIGDIFDCQDLIENCMMHIRLLILDTPNAFLLIFLHNAINHI